MARYDDLDTTAIAYTTFVSTVILVLIILLGRALCYAWIDAEDEKKLTASSYSKSDQIISEQMDQINGYQRVDQEIPGVVDPASPDAPAPVEIREVVRIPIAEAKAILLTELSASPST